MAHVVKRIPEIITHLEGMIVASNEVLNNIPVEVATADMMRQDQEILRDAIYLLRIYQSVRNKGYN